MLEYIYTARNESMRYFRESNDDSLKNVTVDEIKPMKTMWNFTEATQLLKSICIHTNTDFGEQMLWENFHMTYS